MVKIFTVFICLIFAGCGVTVDRWPTYSYYLENATGNELRVVGFAIDSVLSNTDTIFDTTINTAGSLHIYSGYDGFNAGVTLFTLNTESCDTILVIHNDTFVERSFNYRKHPNAIFDSLSTIFYQFDNQEIWVPYDTIEFDGSGPQPKEIKHKYRIE